MVVVAATYSSVVSTGDQDSSKSSLLVYDQETQYVI